MDEPKEFIYKKEAAISEKAYLRAELLSVRGAIADKPCRAEEIAARACAMVKGNVMVYVSIGSEVDTHGLISMLTERDDVIVYVPYTVGGIITPRRLVRLGVADKNGNLPLDCIINRGNSPKLDYCITPLVGFNDDGYRIGYGKGCYDRFFARCNVKKIGLAFDCQRINFIPEPTDMPLDCCVTEKDVIYFC